MEPNTGAMVSYSFHASMLKARDVEIARLKALIKTHVDTCDGAQATWRGQIAYRDALLDEARRLIESSREHIGMEGWVDACESWEDRYYALKAGPGERREETKEAVGPSKPEGEAKQ